MFKFFKQKEDDFFSDEIDREFDRIQLRLISMFEREYKKHKQEKKRNNQ